MGQWTREHIPFPGKAFKETVELMREDALIEDRVLLGGRPISLQDLRWPVLNVIASKDHIVPAKAATPVCELVGSERAETLELPAGHVGLVMGKSAATTTMPKIFAWLHEHGATGEQRATRAEETA
jgi:polyhydroxyalkanoate synthase